MLIKSALENGKLFSETHPSIFFELNRIIIESLISGTPTVLCDKSEILTRMHLGEKYSLKELQDIFNSIMNKIYKKDGPLIPGAAALFHFPEIFQKPKDEYIASLLKKIVNEQPEVGKEGEIYPQMDTIDLYVGNIHVSPIARMWNT